MVSPTAHVVQVGSRTRRGGVLYGRRTDKAPSILRA